MPGKSHGPRSLVGYSPRGRKELDTTERLLFTSLYVMSPLPSFPSFESMSPHHLSRQGSSHYDQSLTDLLNLFALFSLHCTCLQNSQTCLNLALYLLYVCTQVAEHGWSKSTNHGDLSYLKFIVTNLKLNYPTIIIFSSLSFHCPYFFPFISTFQYFFTAFHGWLHFSVKISTVSRDLAHHIVPSPNLTSVLYADILFHLLS